MSISYSLNKIFYLLFSDYRIQIIENTLNCTIVGDHGRYYGRYISYLVSDNINEDKLDELEHILKRHCEIVRKDYNFILKVFHYQLPKFIEYEFHQTNDLVLGVGYNGLARIPLNSETNNYLIVGASGSGKSCLAISIIYNLIQNNVEVWIVDNKESFDYDFLHAPLYKGVNECISILTKFELEINKRMKQNKRHQPLLLVIDEIFPFLCLESKDRKRVMNQLALILSKCRSVNCHVMIITQRATTDIIDSKILANISNRICLATSSKQESINILSSDIAFNISTVGRGYLAINGKLKEFQSYYLDKTKYTKKETVQNVKIEEEKEEVFYLCD